VEPRRNVLAPNLERWLGDTGPESTTSDGERRTLVVRLPAAADTAQAADRLRDVGAAVQTEGAASITVAVTRDGLQRLLDEPWIVAIEEPRRMFPSGPTLPDL
jgi:hypothetical protein